MRAACTALALIVFSLAWGAMPLPSPGEPTVYSGRAGDPWNRVFASLFTRVVRTYVTDEHATTGRYVERVVAGFTRPVRVSEKTVNRLEDGDRAIEAFYPSSMTGAGVDPVLREPGRSTLLRALEDALAETRDRPPLDRALMQSDLWSAFDALSRITRARGVNEDDR